MTGAFCGSFDPLTRGHLDIIERASKITDTLYVFVSVNSGKRSMYSLEQRLEWLEQATAHLPNVECRMQKGLVIEACREAGADILIRGIRSEQDCAYEQNMAFMNSYLDHEIETICLFTRPEYYLYSSSNVRELIKYGQDISMFVPDCVYKTLCIKEEE